ncbi:MAG: TolC family protein [Saprospiraceae bacterium]
MKHQIFILLMMVFASYGQAQDEWSLERCINYALSHNLNIKQNALSVDFAEIDVSQSKHSRYPSLSGGANVSSNFGRTIDPVSNSFITENFFSNGFSLSSGVLLYNGSRISNSIKQANVDKDVAGYNLEQVRRDIALSVSNNFLNVLFAEENYSIAENQLQSSYDQLNRTRKLIAAGVRPANDSLDIKAQIANNEQGIIAAENNKVIALLNIKQLLNLDPDISMILTLPENVDMTTDPDLLDFATVYASALKRQPNIQAAELKVKSAAIGVDIAKAGLLPSVNAGGSIGTNYSNRGRRLDGLEEVIVNQELLINEMPVTVGFKQQMPQFSDNPYTDQLNENLSYGVRIGVNVPIYNNNIAKSNIERAKLNIVNAETQSQLAKNQLKTTIQQAISDGRASKRKLEAANKSRLAQQAAFDNVTKKLNAGNISTFEYISQKNALQRTEVNAVIAKYEYIFSLKVLDFYLGKLITF